MQQSVLFSAIFCSDQLGMRHDLTTWCSQKVSSAPGRPGISWSEVLRPPQGSSPAPSSPDPQGTAKFGAAAPRIIRNDSTGVNGRIGLGRESRRRSQRLSAPSRRIRGDHPRIALYGALWARQQRFQCPFWCPCSVGRRGPRGGNWVGSGHARSSAATLHEIAPRRFLIIWVSRIEFDRFKRYGGLPPSLGPADETHLLLWRGEDEADQHSPANRNKSA